MRPMNRDQLSDLSSGGDGMDVLRRWEVRGAKGSSTCDSQHEAEDLAADRRRYFPHLGPFEVVEHRYVPEQQLAGAVDRVMLVEQALLTACSEAFSDGPAAAAQYIERAQRIAGGQSHV